MIPTPEQFEKWQQDTLAILKKDPKYEIKREFGIMLLRHINSFTAEERVRYEELKRLLKEEKK